MGIKFPKFAQYTGKNQKTEFQFHLKATPVAYRSQRVKGEFVRACVTYGWLHFDQCTKFTIPWVKAWGLVHLVTALVIHICSHYDQLLRCTHYDPSLAVKVCRPEPIVPSLVTGLPCHTHVLRPLLLHRLGMGVGVWLIKVHGMIG